MVATGRPSMRNLDVELSRRHDTRDSAILGLLQRPLLYLAAEVEINWRDAEEGVVDVTGVAIPVLRGGAQLCEANEEECVALVAAATA